MSKEIKIHDEVSDSNTFKSGEKDLSSIAGQYYYLEENVPERLETSEKEPSYFDNRNDRKLIETTYKARRAIKGDVVLLALRLHFTDDILHSVEMAAHPADPDQSTLLFMADEFFTLFKQVDGEAVRVAEIAEVNKRIQEIQQSLTAPPSTPDTLLPATHYKRPTTTELVRVASHKDQMVERANAIAKQAEERMRYLQEGQKEIEQQTRILVNFFQEKAQVALASVGEQIAFAQDLTDGLTSLSLYTGEAVSVHKISQGASADPSIPLHLYQDRLYFDEELAAEGIVGGFDFTEINNLGELFSQNSKIIDRMVPAKRGCVLVRVRREDKLYQLASDGFADMLMNLENKKTYLLIRDGENIYLVHSEITTDKAHHLFPSQSDIDRIFRRFGREVRPEHLDYSKARDDFERNTVFYKRMLLMLWGLNDRQNLFGDFYDKDIHNNWYSEEFQSKHLAYVHDAEGTLTQQRPSLYEWMEEQNSNIQIGSRLVVNWKAIVNPESAPDCYSNRPNHDSKYELQFPPTELFGVALVTAKRNNRLVVRTQAEGWGRSPTKKVRRQVAVDIVRGLALNNAACLCIDDIELADLNYYLESRKERKHYLAYIDLFKMVRDQIEQEEAIQADTHHALINDLLKGVKNEVLAKESLKTAVRLWRAQNGGRLLGDSKWSKGDHETVLNIAFAISGAQNDLIDRLKLNRPDLSVIEIRVDGKGQFWVYSEPSDDDLREPSAKIAVAHVNRNRLKFSKNGLSVTSPHSRVYLANPKFSADYKNMYKRNKLFNPVREETVVGNAILTDKWSSIRLPSSPSYEELSAMAQLAAIDAATILTPDNVEAVADQLWKEIQKPSSDRTVPNISLIRPLCVINVSAERKEGMYLLAVSSDPLEALYVECDLGKELASKIVHTIYRHPDVQMQRLDKVEQSSKPASQFVLIKTESTPTVSSKLPVIAVDDYSGINLHTKNYNILSGDYGVSYDSLKDAVFRSLSLHDKERREQIEFIWINKENEEFANRLYEDV